MQSVMLLACHLRWTWYMTSECLLSQQHVTPQPLLGWCIWEHIEVQPLAHGHNEFWCHAGMPLWEMGGAVQLIAFGRRLAARMDWAAWTLYLTFLPTSSLVHI